MCVNCLVGRSRSFGSIFIQIINYISYKQGGRTLFIIFYLDFRSDQIKIGSAKSDPDPNEKTYKFLSQQNGDILKSVLFARVNRLGLIVKH